jgi:hypothetical protein
MDPEQRDTRAIKLWHCGKVPSLARCFAAMFLLKLVFTASKLLCGIAILAIGETF